MANSGRLSLTEAVVSARLPESAWMDAATAGDVAGVELSLENAVVHIGHSAEDGPRRGPLMLVLSTTPEAMRALGLLLLTKGGAPVFNEREWRLVANTLAAAASAEENDDYISLAAEPSAIREIADRIEEAYR